MDWTIWIGHKNQFFLHQAFRNDLLQFTDSMRHNMKMKVKNRSSAILGSYQGTQKPKGSKALH